MLTLAATACAKPTAFDATSVVCGSFEPIAWSVEDTDETIAQVKEHNAAWLTFGC